MAREISPICDFIFGSLWTCLLTDTVDINLTVRMVKGIYTYRKDHTAESIIFTPWSKKVIPFPSLRQKIQAFQDDKRQNATMPWNSSNTIQFSAPPKTLRKQSTGKIRTQWSDTNCIHPIKTGTLNTLDTKTSELDRIDVKAPIPRQACGSFGLSCSYCEQGALHPLSQELDWSSEDWDGTKAKPREENKSLIDFSDLKPQIKTGQTIDIDKVTFSKLQIGQSNPGEDPLEVMKSLIPPPPVTEAL